MLRSAGRGPTTVPRHGCGIQPVCPVGGDGGGANQSPNTTRGAHIEVSRGEVGRDRRLPSGGHPPGRDRHVRYNPQDPSPHRRSRRGERGAAPAAPPAGPQLRRGPRPGPPPSGPVAATHGPLIAKGLLAVAGSCSRRPGMGAEASAAGGRGEAVVAGRAAPGPAPGGGTPRTTLVTDWAASCVARVLRSAGGEPVTVRPLRRRRAGQDHPAPTDRVLRGPRRGVEGGAG